MCACVYAYIHARVRSSRYPDVTHRTRTGAAEFGSPRRTCAGGWQNASNVSVIVHSSQSLYTSKGRVPYELVLLPVARVDEVGVRACVRAV